MADIHIHIFDVNPTGFCAGRLVSECSRAEQTGEFLRLEYLIDALRQVQISGDKLYVDFRDPTTSSRPKILASSGYLDEAFGGLVRYNGFTESFLKDHLEIVFDEDLYSFLKKSHNDPWTFIAVAQQDVEEMKRMSKNYKSDDSYMSQLYNS